MMQSPDPTPQSISRFAGLTDLRRPDTAGTRHRAAVPKWLVGCLCWWLCTAWIFAQKPADVEARRLEAVTGEVIEIQSGKTHAIPIDLKAGTFLDVNLTEMGIDIALELRDPSGARVAHADRVNDHTDHPERLWYRVATAGPHALRIQASSEGEHAGGAYWLHVAPNGELTEETEVKAHAGAEMFRLRRLTETIGKHSPEACIDGAAEDLERLGLFRDAALLRWQAGLYERRVYHDRLALSLFLRAQEFFQDVGDLFAYVDLERRVAEQLKRLGDFSAEDIYKNALSVAKKNGDPRIVSNIHREFGKYYWFRDRYLDALFQANEALQIALKTGRKIDVLQGYYQRGLCYSVSGLEEESLLDFEKVYNIAMETNDTYNQVSALVQIGWVHYQHERYHDAMIYYDKGMNVCEQVGEYLTGTKIWLMGRRNSTLRELGRFDEALKSYDEILRLRENRSVSPHNKQITYANIAEIYLAKMEETGQDLLEEYWRYVKLAEASGVLAGSPKSDLHDFFNQSRAFLLARDLENALLKIDAAHEIMNEFFSKARGRSLGAAYNYMRTSYYEKKMEILFELVQQEGELSTEYEKQFFQTFEDYRALNLHTLLQSKFLPDDLPEGAVYLYEKWEGLRSRLHQAGDLLDDINTKDVKQRARIELEVSLLEDELYRTEDLLREKAGIIDAGKDIEVDLDNVQNEILGEDTGLVAFHLGKSISFVMGITKSGITIEQLPEKEKIEELVVNINNSYNQRPSAFTNRKNVYQMSAKLVEMCLGPVKNQINGKKNLLIIADGPMLVVPWSALSAKGVFAEPSDDNIFLVDLFNLTLIPSARVLNHLRLASDSSKVPYAMLFGDPVFSSEDKRLLGAIKPVDVSLENEKRNQSRDLVLPIDDRNGSSTRFNKNRLVASRDEVKLIADLLPFKHKLYLDFEANRANFLSEAERATVVHFATHGSISNRQVLSSVVLSTVSEKGESISGTIRPTDIYTQNLNCDLIVLSACELAKGTYVRGEGLLGLPQHFLEAGGRSVVVPLFKVDDVASSNLMVLFYENWIKRNKSKSAALAMAQKQLKSTTKYRDPYYWAGFVLWGAPN
ncbi:CHAT domain-containing protein [Sulfidibacter corallicola]|uniref:CHAT domain-containing protein n=1 Tax=Sulfidibacter corallicola TaxID=2818388 RepID=A0A8A4TYN1_SULCO|nr:CHAT domain-containing tetratricopeptide repeat protein [Sulfidibacter corallicola]QTD51635.1 CHAT domain-containing protein [Sulfidibacter corallicola]